MSQVLTSNFPSVDFIHSQSQNPSRIKLIHPRVLKLTDVSRLKSPVLRIKDTIQPSTGDLKTHSSIYNTKSQLYNII